MVIKNKCTWCKKEAHETGRTEFPSYFILSLECGHTLVLDRVGKSVYEDVKSKEGHTLYPFQAKTCDFGESANLRFIVAHEMGLGKTVIPCAIIKKHPEIYPVIIVVKGSLILQWMRHIVSWTGMYPQIIRDSKTPVEPKYFRIFITTYDLLGKITFPFDPQLLILDECQQIKNSEAKRTQSVREISKRSKYVIALSGTPIKNNAAEYFPILNIVRPEKFPSLAEFLRSDVAAYTDGYRTRIGGLRNIDAFKQKTDDFIIRYSREEVMPDLPKIRRTYQFNELGAKVRAYYAKTYEEFEEAVEGEGDKSKFSQMSDILTLMNRLKHITGISKVDQAVDFTSDFLLSSDRKLTLFHHYKDVGSLLEGQINSILAANGMKSALRLTSDKSGEERDRLVQEFTSDPSRRILIASTLASGEGLNLQVCSDAIVVERQWNPANEEQAEGRFSRIGSVAKSVNVTYLVAVDTIDEFLSELVERKREIILNTLDGKLSPWAESDMISELKNILMSKGKKKWNIYTPNKEAVVN